MALSPKSSPKLPLDLGAYAARSLTWRLWRRYRLVWRRRILLFKAFRARHDLVALQDRTTLIKRGEILCFVTLRNESERLPHFLDHHRALGVGHFLIVDNDSSDGSSEFLKNQPDVSLWYTKASYRKSRFGVAWLTRLQRKYGSGHWCLTLDCDELLIYPKHNKIDLHGLTKELERRKKRSFRTVMIELYPRGPLDQQAYRPGDDPTLTLPFFDADNFVRYQHPEFLSLIEKGGVRARYFFSDRIKTHAPHMQKTPLVHWRRRYAYLDSTHTILPRKLNNNFGSDCISGALLHTKFLPTILEKSADSSHRAEHFTQPSEYEEYYDQIVQSPDFWHAGAIRYQNWQQIVDLKLMSDAEWRD